jgi:uncharacterized protein
VPLPSRRAALVALGLTGLAAGAAGVVTRPWEDGWDDLPDTTLVLATGNPGGVFHRYGDALATVLEQRVGGVRVETRSTNASVVNLRQVATREVDVGLTLGDASADAARGTGAFDSPVAMAALARTYDSFVHLVVRADSPITEVRDLAGRRVGLGALGSGTRVIAGRVLTVAGLDPAAVTGTDDPLEQAAAALAAGRLDAFFFVSGLPNSAVVRLIEQTPIRLIDLAGLLPEMVSAHGPGYTLGPVPASTYDLPGAAETLSVTNHVVVHPDLDDTVAYAVTRVMFEEQAAIDRVAPGVGQPNLGAAVFTSPLPLHRGAERYYRELRA